MSDGFRGIKAARFAVPLIAPTVLDGPGSAVIPNVGDYSCLELPLSYTGTPGTPAPPEVLKIRLEWSVEGHLSWVTSLEVPNAYCAGFGGRQAFLLTPVFGETLTIIIDGGSAAAANPTLTYSVWGSWRTLSSVVVWQDMTDSNGRNEGTDLHIVNESGQNIPQGKSVTVMSGLASGPYSLSGSIVFGTGKATVGVARLQFIYGLDGLGPPDLFITQSTTASTTSFPFSLTGNFLPRRPLRVTIFDNGAGTTHNLITWWGVSVIRAEP